MKNRSFRISLLCIGIAVLFLSSCGRDESRQWESETNQTAVQTNEESLPEETTSVPDLERSSGTEQESEQATDPPTFEVSTADIGNLTDGWTHDYR